MAILDIRVLGDPILREQTKPVETITDDVRQLIDDMFETMHAAEGLGLAAPQVGRSERIAIMEVDEEEYVLINPEIVSKEGSERGEEGCLSIPNLMGHVDRSAHIVVRATDQHGEEYELEASGILARCIQHEVDHLHGKLYIDYLSILKRRALAKKWELEVEDYPGFIRKLEPLPPKKASLKKKSKDKAV